MDSTAPPSFMCPIKREIMHDPVSCSDGHSYERDAIEQWFQHNSASPATGAELADLTLTPNHALRNAVEEWLASNFKLLPRSSITIEDAVIARGSYKTVHRGTLVGHSNPVAVLKMRQQGACEEEAAKLVKLGRHTGLVRYLGICTEGPDQLLVTELAPHGSLDQFVEAHDEDITMAHKLTMLQQICAGMIALTTMGLIHRDLAARNVLVFSFDKRDPLATVVKITDFGLTVERHYQTHATVAGDEVPFRWMPPEALKKRRFSEKSDVWAFGVVAWELLTDGDVPFAFISSNEAVAQRVCAGERLTKPEGCPQKLWALLLRTWADKAKDRPSFIEVAQELSSIEKSARPSPSSAQHQQGIIQVSFERDWSPLGHTDPLGPFDLPPSMTASQLREFASSVTGYPCRALQFIQFKNGTPFCGFACSARENATLADFLANAQETSFEGNWQSTSTSANGVPLLCFKVDGPQNCMKCNVESVLGYSRDQAYLPRFGGSGSFDNYGGTALYILACQGYRRQCGNCWKQELGADWEMK